MKTEHVPRRLALCALVILLSLNWSALPVAAQAPIVFQAVDNDAENKLWECETRRTTFGKEGDDLLRCFTFRFQVPTGGITSAAIHVSIKAPTGSLQDTDSTHVAVDQPFSECSWAQGKMAGCVVLHGGFRGGETSLNLDLLNAACDTSVTISPEMQQAINRQLRTGVVHLMLQDDTAVMSARLILNATPTSFRCGTSENPNVPIPGVPIDTQPGTTATTPTSVPGTSLPAPPYGTPEPAPVSRMTIQVGQRRVVAGELVTIPVFLLRGADVANINFTITYQANVARPEGTIQRGNLIDNAIFSANPNESGLILAGFARTNGVSGTGTVAYVPFRAAGRAGDRTELHVEVTTINNPNGTVLAIDRIDGAIQIVGPDGLVPGDCDGDGVLNELDALCALQMSVRLIPTQMVLDLDIDRQVTSRDSVIILQRAIGRA